MRRAVFLDRDGVINRAVVRAGRPYPPGSVSEVEILGGVDDALRRFRAAGLLNIVVTNQPDVARGTTTREAVEAIHRYLRENLAIDAFYTCWHDDIDRCDCRKPLPGLLLRAAMELNLNLSSSVLVGDRWRDIEAGQRAGCRTVRLDLGYAEPEPDCLADLVTTSLVGAADWILLRN